MAPLEIRDRSVRPISAKHAQASRFLQQSLPIYHLYFADELGTPGPVMTTFPTRRTGLTGRKGSNQFTVCTYSIPKSSLERWTHHLTNHRRATVAAGTRSGHR